MTQQRPLPGVFRPLSHNVPGGAKAVQLDGHYAHQLGWTGRWALVATCGALCWPQPTQPTPTLAWCPRCQPPAITSNHPPTIIWPPEPDHTNTTHFTLTRSA